MFESFADVEALEEHLSRPTQGAVATLARLDGDIVVLGAGGKMGPTLARMARRALDAAGHGHRRVTAVSRFSNPAAREALHRHGVQTISSDLLDPAAVEKLPDAGCVVHMTGQKFGTADAPERTWAVNTLAPTWALRRYHGSRVVLFSTGCVYPLLPVNGPGADETTPLEPPGEYANACVARERVAGWLAGESATPLVLFRLCYAVEPRYGVIHDIARRVAEERPVDLSMGFVNLVWQRDANARALECLALAGCPPVALNVTGCDRPSVRALAARCGQLLGKEPIFTGTEGSVAWIWDARRCESLFGPPETTTDEAVGMVCEWIARGGESLGKATKFEVRDGRY